MKPLEPQRSRNQFEMMASNELSGSAPANLVLRGVTGRNSERRKNCVKLEAALELRPD